MHLLIQTPQQLCAHLLALRKARNWTQATLARQLNVSQGRIAQMEKAPDKLSVGQFMRLLSALDAQLLIQANPPAPPPTTAATQAPTPDSAPGDW